MLVDLRSDTVTTPTPGMYARMANAPVGDDGLEGDPTTRLLEETVAERLGKPAGLYTPTATMANLLAVLAQVQRCETLIAGATSHIYTTERGATTLTGAFIQTVPDANGALDLPSLTQAVLSSKSNVQPRLICVETSHNNEGGAVAPLDHMRDVYEIGSSSGIAVHLDGARIFNAAIALGVSVAEVAKHADTVSVCLSKGLSAPMGAVLVGDVEVVRKARVMRKMLGGTQRQVGVVAAAGIEALESMSGRLEDDHHRARELAEGLKVLDCVAVRDPQTNIVQIDVARSGISPTEWEVRLRERGVLVRAWGPTKLRCVTHRLIDQAAIQTALDAVLAVADELDLKHF